MNQRAQDALFRVVIGVPALWVGWDALRAFAGTALLLVTAPPSERGIVTTVFLLSYGLVPGVAMAGCVGLAVGLMAKYPERGQARSLAALCLSVGLVFGQFFLPTLVNELERFGAPIIPGGEVFGDLATTSIFGLGVALAPAWLFWFSASFPDVPPHLGQADRRFVILTKLQRLAFRSPAVLLVGAIPIGVAAAFGGDGGMAVGLITLGLGLASLWLTHLTVSEPALGRTAVVMIALAMPAIPFVLWPLADLLPQFSPFFRFDALVLGTGGALCAMVLGLAYAVFVQGAVGPALVLKRGLWLGGGSAVVVFVFAGLENSLADLVVERAGLPGSLGTFVSAGIMAVLITSLRDRLGRKRERRPAP